MPRIVYQDTRQKLRGGGALSWFNHTTIEYEKISSKITDIMLDKDIQNYIEAESSLNITLRTAGVDNATPRLIPVALVVASIRLIINKQHTRETANRGSLLGGLYRNPKEEERIDSDFTFIRISTFILA